jgi:hypothetical protein
MLSDDQIKRGQQWFLDHRDHVIDLIKSAEVSFEPSGSDKNHPELWKAASWKWFKECKFISVSTTWDNFKKFFSGK